MTRRALARLGVSERHLAISSWGRQRVRFQSFAKSRRPWDVRSPRCSATRPPASPEWLLFATCSSGVSTAISDAPGRPWPRLRARGEAGGAQASSRAGRPARRRQVDLWPDAGRRSGRSFLELNREIERVAGWTVAEIHNLYGPTPIGATNAAHWRTQFSSYPGLRDRDPGRHRLRPATFNLLLSHCFTVWLRAAPEEHMRRVEAQGDLRPMSGNRQRPWRTFAGSSPRGGLLWQGGLSFDTSGKPLALASPSSATAVHAALEASPANHYVVFELDPRIRMH